MSSLDLRSLALLRIGCALALLADLGERATRLTADYTDQGTLPRWAVPDAPWLSLHMLGGSWLFQASLFGLAAGLAVALLVGWRTRVVSVLCWWLLLSVQLRNPLILSMGDGLLLLTLFWGMLLPWGERWSRDHPGGAPGSVRGFACAGYVWQMACVYPMTAWLKAGPEWTRDHDAVYFALTAAQYETPLGQTLRELLMAHPAVDHALTQGVLLLELALGPLLVLPRTRGLGIAAVLVLQASLGSCLSLGFFPVFASLAVVGMLPWKDTIPAEPAAESPLRRLLVGLVLGLSLLNFLVQLPASVRRVLGAVGLNQSWYMFAPSPPAAGGWYLLVGLTKDGHQVDLARPGQPLAWERPGNVPEFLGGQRPTMYYFRLLTRRNWANQRPVHAAWLARRWAGTPLERVQMFYLRRPTIPYGREGDFERVLIWEGPPGAE